VRPRICQVREGRLLRYWRRIVIDARGTTDASVISERPAPPSNRRGSAERAIINWTENRPSGQGRMADTAVVPGVGGFPFRILLTVSIRTGFEQSDRSYGSPRVWRDLLAWGHACGENRCRLSYLMRLFSLHCETVPLIMRLDGKNESQHRARYS
jgi:hypothetical protein